MNKAIFLIVGAFLGIGLSIIYLEHKEFTNPEPWITVEVRNDTEQKITKLTITANNTTVSYTNLAPGDSKKIPVAFVGDGNYSATFKLENGTICNSGVGYAEVGRQYLEVLSSACKM